MKNFVGGHQRLHVAQDKLNEAFFAQASQNSGADQDAPDDVVFDRHAFEGIRHEKAQGLPKGLRAERGRLAQNERVVHRRIREFSDPRPQCRS